MYGQAYLGLASGIMTLAILVLSEILPKTIGAKYWRKLVPSMCITLRVMIVLLRPFLYISSFIMGMFGSAEDASDIKDEIKALAKWDVTKKFWTTTNTALSATLSTCRKSASKTL